ncbi:ABC transporter ATP-binding protein [Methanotorris igneus]|uniref:Xenobiotic-transporting ATPase n=1 Tax=Methanotorris igneus (strain DSM 5666 / JCM 11834 / Kol 5) TaxID=880724 RepID=F6BB75_METIK|nr:ABC transporter ATP-binding protein [Methanotorris igneus]AEF95960.1 Xenobiotic-transporting ATPase [Methanotorris igneus Kol 5]
MLLVVKDLYLKRGDRMILKGLNLEIEENEIHAVVGPNGAGKSTLSYTLMGCSGYEPVKGEIIFKGINIVDKSITERARMGMTLAWQEPARFEGITVKQYLSLGMKEYDEEKIYKALEFVNLCPDTYLNRFVDDSLSGGERKRIELASILCMEPDLAILDEPDSGIDIVSLDEITKLFKHLKKNGSSVLVITHREEITNCADKASLLCDGRVIKTGDPKEVGEYYKRECGKCLVKVPSIKKEVEEDNNE